MKNQIAIQERYLRDAVPVRLGALAANLARMKSFSSHPDHRDVVERLLEESKFFIEWTAGDAEPELQAQLADIQLQLARWQRRWNEIWADRAQRAAMARQAEDWSRRLLSAAGLV